MPLAVTSREASPTHRSKVPDCRAWKLHEAAKFSAGRSGDIDAMFFRSGAQHFPAVNDAAHCYPFENDVPFKPVISEVSEQERSK